VSLPFNLNLETARTYLAHLDVSRESLLRAFQRDEGVVALAPSLAIAAETLMLSPLEFELITDMQFDGRPSKLESDATADVFGFRKSASPLAGEEFLTTTPPLQLESLTEPPTAPAQVKALQC